jgi:hypothetical protein
VANEQKRTDTTRGSANAFPKTTGPRDKQRIVDFRVKLYQDNIVDENRNCQQRLHQQVYRIENNRLAQLALRYQPCGNRDEGHPKRRWREHNHPKANEVHRTGLTALNLQRSQRRRRRRR